MGFVRQNTLWLLDFQKNLNCNKKTPIFWCFPYSKACYQNTKGYFEGDTIYQFVNMQDLSSELVFDKFKIYVVLWSNYFTHLISVNVELRFWMSTFGFITILGNIGRYFDVELFWTPAFELAIPAGIRTSWGTACTSDLILWVDASSFKLFTVAEVKGVSPLFKLKQKILKDQTNFSCYLLYKRMWILFTFENSTKAKCFE